MGRRNGIAPWDQDIVCEIWDEIVEERHRQDDKFGWLESSTSGMANGTGEKKLAILAEEFGEVAHALLEHDDENLEEELVQVAAVAVAWLQARREHAGVANLGMSR